MTLVLLLKYWREAAIVAAIAGLAFFFHENNIHQQEVGAMKQRNARLVAYADSLAGRIGDSERHVKKDTVVVTRVATEYDTLYRDRETKLTDTVWVKTTLAKGDTLVRACRMLVADCALANAQKDTMIANLHEQLRNQTKLTAPSKLGLAVKLVTAVGVGYAIHAVTH